MVLTDPAGPPTRGHKKRERTRNQLIGAGLRVFARKGETLTVSDVVAEAEVSNGTFYNYFVDRDQLFDVLAEQLASMLAAEAAAEIETGDSAVRVASASSRVLARAEADPTWARLVMRLDSLGDEIHTESTRYMRDDLERGFAQGRFEVGADRVTVDLISASLASAIRRIVAGAADRDYLVGMLGRILRALGVPMVEAVSIADRALADAQSAVGPAQDVDRLARHAGD
jgi:AcrR family transcriptional regulator